MEDDDDEVVVENESSPVEVTGCVSSLETSHQILDPLLLLCRE